MQLDCMGLIVITPCQVCDIMDGTSLGPLHCMVPKWDMVGSHLLARVAMIWPI